MLVGVGRDALALGLPTGGLERLVRLVRVHEPVLLLRLGRLPARLRRARAFPVVPRLFYRLHFVPEYLVLRAVGLDDHPVLPGRHHRSRAVYLLPYDHLVVALGSVTNFFGLAPC